ASNKSPDRNDGADRLFDELCLWSVNRRFSISTDHSNRAQSAILPRVDRELRLYEGKRLVRVVVCRPLKSRNAFAAARNALENTLACHHSSSKSEGPARREQTASPNF